MNSSCSFALHLFLGVTLCGCALPTPDFIDRVDPAKPIVGSAPPVSPYTVKDLQNHIYCEIVNADQFKALQAAKYNVQVTLALKVEDNGGVSPNLGFLASNFVYAMDANVNLDRYQIYNTSYVLDISDMTQNPVCDGLRATAAGQTITHSLAGDLGINSIISSGLSEIDLGKSAVSAPSSGSGTPAKTPNFGSTVQFMLTLGFDTGPSWSLTTFKGPNGSKGVLNGGRVTTDNLIVAFAAPPVQAKNASLEDYRKVVREELERALNPSGKPKGFSEDQINRLLDLFMRQASATPAPSPSTTELQSFTNSIILQNLSGQLHQ